MNIPWENSVVLERSELLTDDAWGASVASFPRALVTPFKTARNTPFFTFAFKNFWRYIDRLCICEKQKSFGEALLCLDTAEWGGIADFCAQLLVMTRDSHGEADVIDGVDTLTGARGTSTTILPRAFVAPWIGTRAAPIFAILHAASFRRERCMQCVHGL